MTVELKIPITLGEIFEAVGKKAPVARAGIRIGSALVKRIVTNSREAVPGDLFIAIRGECANGNDHIEEAHAQGAFTLSDEKGCSDIFVEGVYPALGDIAAFYKSRLKNLVATVGITGSIGKTTTKNFISTLLRRRERVHATRGNENNLLGVPLTIFSSPPDTELLINEAGMNQAGELSEISRIIKPTVALITNVGTAHIGNFGTRGAIAKAKLELFEGASEGASLLIPYGEPLLSSASALTVAEGYEERADFSIVRTTSANVGGDFLAGGERLFSFSTGITAGHLLPLLGFSFATCLQLGMSPQEISFAARGLSDKETRLRTFNIGALTVIDDAYNSSLEAVRGALLYLEKIDMRPRIALLGDILELGEMAEAIHYEVGRLAAMCVDALYVCGEHRDAVTRGACDNGLQKTKIRALDDKSPEGIASTIKDEITLGALLIKGSHKTGLHRVSELLLNTEDKK